jgi:negative regulator of flagellin synthesis FlgM
VIFFLKLSFGLPLFALSAQVQGTQAMVDPIGIKAGTVVDRRQVSVAAASSVEPVKTVTAEPKAVETAAAEISQTMAAQPPVDSERVAKIRRAVQDGRFPIYPSTIADRLLALKLEWNPNGEA